jgi:hypothetical protein
LKTRFLLDWRTFLSKSASKVVAGLSNWGPVFFGLIGLSLAAYGMFGYFFVIGPPLVKLAYAGALIYATFRNGWSFRKA